MSRITGPDGSPATAALLANPNGIAFDSSGNPYIADTFNRRVRLVGTNGIITTVAGGGPFRSDPVITNAQIDPMSVAADARGNVYIAERGNLVRVLNAQWTGAIAGYPAGGLEIRRSNGFGGFDPPIRTRVTGNGGGVTDMPSATSTLTD